MQIRLEARTVKAVAWICVVVMVFIGAYFALDAWERHYGETTLQSDNNTVYINGEEYVPKSGISTILIMGIDKTGQMNPDGDKPDNGQNDFVVLVMLDRNENAYTLVQLNRDTMTLVNILDDNDGHKTGSEVMQLALAHAYGGKQTDSCENAVEAVENFLYGIEIDHYISMNMSAVELLTDAVGGVTVTITDDFSKVDETLKQGETITLNGEQCVTYIRSRKDVGDQTNISRSERQKEFIYELIPKIDTQTIDDEILTVLTQYIVSDMSANRIRSAIKEIAEADCRGIVVPEGEALKGEEFMEFYADEESVKSIVTGLFYTRT